MREDGVSQRYITGYAVVFEQDSRPLYDYFVEQIARGAFDNCDMSDVVMVVDHSRDVRDVLARSKNGSGSLEINIDERGVKFRFAVPNTTVGNDIAELVERGDISECSFCFIAKRDEWEFDKKYGDKTYDCRRVLEVERLIDLAIVVRGAYPQTSVENEERALAEEICQRMTPAPKQMHTMGLRLAKALSEL
jgi:HK97 family phage prohead protease